MWLIWYSRSQWSSLVTELAFLFLCVVLHNSTLRLHKWLAWRVYLYLTDIIIHFRLWISIMMSICFQGGFFFNRLQTLLFWDMRQSLKMRRKKSRRSLVNFWWIDLRQTYQWSRELKLTICSTDIIKLPYSSWMY